MLLLAARFGIKTYNEGARGWGLFGAIAGGAVMGGAMGGLFVFGGAVALGVVGVGFGAGVVISAGVGFAAGLISYSFENGLRDDKKWTGTNFALAGFAGLFKGMFTFGLGFAGGKKGAFDKSVLKPLLKGVSTLDYSITYAIAKAIMGRKVLLTRAGETFLKTGIFGAIGFVGRWIIDKVFS